MRVIISLKLNKRLKGTLLFIFYTYVHTSKFIQEGRGRQEYNIRNIIISPATKMLTLKNPKFKIYWINKTFHFIFVIIDSRSCLINCGFDNELIQRVLDTYHTDQANNSLIHFYKRTDDDNVKLSKYIFCLNGMTCFFYWLRLLYNYFI